MLNTKQVNHYKENGFVIPDFKVPEEVLECIRSDYDKLLALHPEFRDFCPSLLSYDMGFLDYARIPEIISMVSQVIGPDVILWNASFFAKPALDGKKTPWHQDGQYWAISPLETCTVWIAVDAATTENGCMRFLPGSHKDKNCANTDLMGIQISLFVKNCWNLNMMIVMPSKSYLMKGRFQCTMFIYCMDQKQTIPNSRGEH